MSESRCFCYVRLCWRRDTRALLAAGQDAEAHSFITDNTHPRLWRLLAEHALERLDLPTAEKGFVHCRDMQGLQLVRHISKLGDKDKQQAEVRLAHVQLFNMSTCWHLRRSSHHKNIVIVQLVLM